MGNFIIYIGDGRISLKANNWGFTGLYDFFLSEIFFPEVLAFSSSSRFSFCSGNLEDFLGGGGGDWFP